MRMVINATTYYVPYDSGPFERGVNTIDISLCVYIYRYLVPGSTHNNNQIQPPQFHFVPSFHSVGAVFRAFRWNNRCDKYDGRRPTIVHDNVASFGMGVRTIILMIDDTIAYRSPV